MCKEALFIYLNHLAVSFSRSVGKNFQSIKKKLFCIEKTYADSLLSKHIALKVQISFIRCKHVQGSFIY